jgi:hypothetical protein
MKESSTKVKERLNWRWNKIQELSVKGFNQADISRMLQISEPTISRDIQYLKRQARESIESHIHERLPYEYSNCIKGLDEIIKESWLIAAKAEKVGNDKEQLSSLSLIKDSYSTKMDLLTNASLLKDSIKFIQDAKEKLAEDSSTNTSQEPEQEQEPQDELTTKF